jgi:5-methylcytosine-specific restriction endonuclease McrA
VSKSPVPKALWRRVAAEARHRCGYCLAAEAFGVAMELDHLIPAARGGRTIRSNLWLACDRCNKAKSGRVRIPDPVTRKMVRLFNPRRNRWSVHFRWTDGGLRIEGITPIGRATERALALNRPVHITARRFWIVAGVFPPRD